MNEFLSHCIARDIALNTKQVIAFPSDRFALVLQWLKNFETDERTMVILAAARIDELLELTLKKTMINALDSKSRLFSTDGAVGTFSARIDLSYAMGVIDEDFFRFLHILRKLRNHAAHLSEPMSFSVDPHLGRVAELSRLCSTSGISEYFSGLHPSTNVSKKSSLELSLIIGVLAAEWALVVAVPLSGTKSCGFKWVSVLPTGGDCSAV